MTVRKTILGVLALLLISTMAFAQSDARNGTTAASYLLVPQGARYLSGGGAVANVTGLESVFWNPAGLATTEKSLNAMFSRRSYIADIDVNFVAASLSSERLGAFAISLRNFDIGDIPITTVFAPDGTGGVYSPTVFSLGVTYAKRLTDRTSVGISLNYLNESFERVAATGIAFDVGVQYRTFMDVEGWSIGVVLRNFGSPVRYGGSGLWQSASAIGNDRKVTFYKIEAASFDLPSIVNLGTSYSIPVGESSSLELGLTFENNETAQNDFKLLGEYSLSDMLALRGSWVISEKESKDFALENIFANNISFGGSLNLRAATGIDISFDYAFITTEIFDNNQVLSFRFGF